jgi:hypothetical protein
MLPSPVLDEIANKQQINHINCKHFCAQLNSIILFLILKQCSVLGSEMGISSFDWAQQSRYLHKDRDRVQFLKRFFL